MTVFIPKGGRRCCKICDDDSEIRDPETILSPVVARVVIDMNKAASPELFHPC
jgi:hypothetical protein